MFELPKEIISVAAVVVTVFMFVPYIVSIHRGVTKPHVFSWVIWGVGTITVGFAQYAGDAGVGAWPIGISGVITCYIAFLAYIKRGDTQITKTDWAFFVAAFSALPMWFVTTNPLWAVVILTIVDTLAFGPTFRKGWLLPHEENTWAFFLVSVRNFLVILALEHYSTTTVLFPAVVGTMGLVLVAMLIFRKRMIRAQLAADDGESEEAMPAVPAGPQVGDPVVDRD